MSNWWQIWAERIAQVLAELWIRSRPGTNSRVVEDDEPQSPTQDRGSHPETANTLPTTDVDPPR